MALELSSSGPNPWNFVPRCREDGGYYEVQCHVGTGQCWCVDINGNERWGTAARGLPDCLGRLANSCLNIVLKVKTHLNKISLSPFISRSGTSANLVVHQDSIT